MVVQKSISRASMRRYGREGEFWRVTSGWDLSLSMKNYYQWQGV